MEPYTIIPFQEFQRLVDEGKTDKCHSRQLSHGSKVTTITSYVVANAPRCRCAVVIGNTVFAFAEITDGYDFYCNTKSLPVGTVNNPKYSSKQIPKGGKNKECILCHYKECVFDHLAKIEQTRLCYTMSKLRTVYAALITNNPEIKFDPALTVPLDDFRFN